MHEVHEVQDDKVLGLSEETFRLIVETFPGLVAVMTPTGEIEHVNNQEAEEAIRSGLHSEAEHRVVRADGDVRTVHGLGTVKRDKSGRAYEMFGTVQDITDRKRAAEVLLRTQAHFSRGPTPGTYGKLDVRWISAWAHGRNAVRQSC
jgi:hypothetical protein